MISWLKGLPINEVIIDEANEICRGRIRYNNTWDMERCNDPNDFPINNISPNGDGEWIYQYSRMEYLHKLILAYVNSCDKKYLNCYFNIADTFFNKNSSQENGIDILNPPLVKKILRRLHIINYKTEFPTYRTLDTAIRCYSLTIDILYIEQLPAGSDFTERIKKIKNRILNDIDFALNNLTSFDSTSNWGIIIMSLAMAVKLIHGHGNEVLTIEKKLIEFLRKQVKKDGGHIECALMYHSQILICLLRLIFWSQRCNYSLDHSIIEICNKMALYSYTLRAPDGYQIQYGDSDKSKMDTVLFLSKKILSTPQIDKLYKPEDIILLMEFPNIEYKDITESCCAEKIVNRVFDNGIWVFRSSELNIRVFNEVSTSSHKHADNAEIVVYYNDRPLLVDCGRFTYDKEKERLLYRGPFAHNIVTVDNGVEWTPLNKNKFMEYPTVVKNKQINTRPDICSFVSAYVFENSGIYIERQFFVIGIDTIVIISFAKCSGSHKLSTIWNLPENINAKEFCEGYVLSDELDEYSFSLICDTHMLRESKLSYHYNEEICANQIIANTNFVDCGNQVAIISCSKVNILGDDLHGYVINIGEKSVNLDTECGTIWTLRVEQG